MQCVASCDGRTDRRVNRKEIVMIKTPRSSLSKLTGAIAGIFILAAGGEAAAQLAPNNPVGLWTAHWAFDTSAPMAQTGTQQVCFLSNGTWFGTTFPAWSGQWFEKGNAAAGMGDHVSASGNYASNVGNDAWQFDFVTVNMMTGPWVEWRDNFAYLAYVRTVFTRTGTCGADMAASPAQAPGGTDDPLGKVRK